MVTLNLKQLYPKMASMLRQSRVRQLVVGTLPEVLPFPKSLLYPIVKGRDIAKVPNDREHTSFRELLHNDGSYEPAPLDPEKDVAVLQYTGGTTGVSKGAMLTHANLYINTQQTALWFTDVEPGAERILGVLPFFHVFAMTVVMNQGIHIGAEIIMHPRFELEAVLKDIVAKKPTLMPGVPTMFAAINNHPKLSDFDVSSLKGCISGGAPLPLEVKQRFEERSGCSVFEGYGLTECSPVASANPMQGSSKENSIGLPVPGTRIVITDRDDPHKVLPLGETGEICIEGPQVMAGYWRNDEATEKTIVDGRLHTGDVGYIDEDGYTFIIASHKGSDPHWRLQRVSAQCRGSDLSAPRRFRVHRDRRSRRLLRAVRQGLRQTRESQTLTADELADFLKDNLGKHEIPKHIEFRAELPKTMIGKLSKKELVAEEVEKYQKGQGCRVSRSLRDGFHTARTAAS